MIWRGRRRRGKEREKRERGKEKKGDEQLEERYKRKGRGTGEERQISYLKKY